jgi:hypothetical protein
MPQNNEDYVIYESNEKTVSVAHAKEQRLLSNSEQQQHCQRTMKYYQQRERESTKKSTKRKNEKQAKRDSLFGQD